MRNSERFLNAFNTIERYLRGQIRANNDVTFYQLVDDVSRSKPVVRRFKQDLKEYADLRNAIVHERGGGHVLAEPNEQAVNDIERIASFLLKPPTLIPLFQTQVITLDKSKPISNAVELILKRSISQIPILDGNRIVSLLTTNTIARWLGKVVNENLVDLKATTIAQVLQYTEDEDNYALVKRDTTIFEALECFQEFESQGKPLQALLITEYGQPKDRIIGIITIFDLPKALDKISKG